MVKRVCLGRKCRSLQINPTVWLIKELLKRSGIIFIDNDHSGSISKSDNLIAILHHFLGS